MRPALPALAAVLVLAALPLGGQALVPQLLVGEGTVTYRNYYGGITCPDMDFRLQMEGVDEALVLTIQAVGEPFCTLGGWIYSVNPSVMTGDREHGWTGSAVGAEPPVVWPYWPVVIGPATDPQHVSFWSYYVDVNGRDYVVEGEFAIVAGL